MQSKTLIAAVAFGVALSVGPMVSANWQHTRWGMTPEQVMYLRQSRRLAVCWPLKGACSQTV
jgi:hypothetical protein